jgi:hypothetical protein
VDLRLEDAEVKDGGFFASSEFHTPVDGAKPYQATDAPLPEQTCGGLSLRPNLVSRCWYRDIIREMPGWIVRQ